MGLIKFNPFYVLFFKLQTSGLNKPVYFMQYKIHNHIFHLFYSDLNQI